MDLEARARLEVRSRAGSGDPDLAVCEITGSDRSTDFSHRIPAGRGGPWRPANGLHLARPVHEWLEAHPNLARAGGWAHLRGNAPLQETPVWLARPWPGWWLIEDRTTDGPHLLIPIDANAYRLPERPAMPFESRRAA